MATIAAEPRGPVAVVGHNRGYRLFVSVAAAAALLVVAVLLLLLPMLRFVGYPVTWPIVLIVLSVPLWPDLIA